jgi:L,D-peptidoglycan transpeptidase YkuD (ErfK/YbiS/YcfS/YnhG family)
MASQGPDTKGKTVSLIEVDRRGWLRVGSQSYRCALGRAGVKRDKREADGATPAGTLALRAVLYRADRLAAPATGLPIRPIDETDGWCDAPTDPHYNDLVALPYPASHERLWRADRLYDLLAVIGYNDRPARPGLGSAIFLHVAQADYAPTEGCVALSLADLTRVLARCGPETIMTIGAD